MAHVNLTITAAGDRGSEQVIVARKSSIGWDVFTNSDPFRNGADVMEFATLQQAAEFAVKEALAFVNGESIEPNSVFGELR